MATLLDEFKSITTALNDAGIEYAVCGGWAMAIHGLPRATMDIDLLVRPDDAERMMQSGYSRLLRNMASISGASLYRLRLKFSEFPKSIRS